METYSRPVPVPDEETAEFWVQARQHRLVFQQCQYCQTFAHPPQLFCRHCRQVSQPRFAFEQVSGRGKIINWTVMRDAMVTGFDPPWVNVLVELEEQPHLFFVATLEDGPVPGLKLGAQVEVVFKDITDEISLPFFKLA